MNIAVLAWGSLVWKPGNLRIEGAWTAGGPELPIEFSRVSRDCRLTLVLDGTHGAPMPVRYAKSGRRALNDAIADLRDREGTIWSRIGFVDRISGDSSASAFAQPEGVFEKIDQWVKREGFDAAIWTALPPSFKEQTGHDFSLEAAENYLRLLPKGALAVALEYLQRAPNEVETPLRVHLAARNLIGGKTTWGVT